MKRAARLVAVLGAATVAACFTKPDSPHVGGDGHAPDDAMPGDPDARDARPIDALDAFVPLPCPRDDFALNIPNCETWGNSSGAATFTRAGAVLGIVFSGMNQLGKCTTKTPVNITNGTSIRIEQMPQAGPVTLELTTAGFTTTFNASRPTGMYGLQLSCSGIPLGNVTTSLVPPTWLQLKVDAPVNGEIRVTGETSTNGTSWTFLQSCNYAATLSSQGTVAFSANSGSGGGSALLDDFNINNCPP